MILKFSEFFNESKQTEYFYRNTSEEFLYNLLKNKSIKNNNKNRKYISLSEDKNSGGQDDYGPIKIWFNIDEIMSQGGIYVDYEDPDFWKQEPNIAQHVTGYKNEKEYYKSKDFKNGDESNENGELSWEQYCEDFSGEMEILIPEIKMTPNLIYKIESKKTLSNKTIELLKLYNIDF